MLGSYGGFPLKHSAAESILSAIVGYFRVALFNSESYSVSVPVLGTGKVPVSVQGHFRPVPGRSWWLTGHFRPVPGRSWWLTGPVRPFQDVLSGHLVLVGHFTPFTVVTERSRLFLPVAPSLTYLQTGHTCYLHVYFDHFGSNSSRKRPERGNQSHGDSITDFSP